MKIKKLIEDLLNNQSVPGLNELHPFYKGWVKNNELPLMCFFHYENYLIVNTDLPAVIKLKNNRVFSISYRKDDRLHRDEGVAHINFRHPYISIDDIDELMDSLSRKENYQDLPPEISCLEFYNKGQPHREDGPARAYRSVNKIEETYAVEGDEVTKKEIEDIKNRKEISNKLKAL